MSATPLIRLKAIELAGMGEEQQGALIARVKAAEEAILGEAQTGSLIDRIKTLEENLGTTTGDAPPAPPPSADLSRLSTAGDLLMHITYSREDSELLVRVHDAAGIVEWQITGVMSNQGAEWFKAWLTNLRKAKGVCVFFTEGNAQKLNNQGIGYKEKFATRMKEQGEKAPLYMEAMAILDMAKKNPDFKIYVVDGIKYTPEQFAFNLKKDAPSFGPVEKWTEFVKGGWKEYEAHQEAGAAAAAPPAAAAAPAAGHHVQVSIESKTFIAHWQNNFAYEGKWSHGIFRRLDANESRPMELTELYETTAGGSTTFETGGYVWAHWKKSERQLGRAVVVKKGEHTSKIHFPEDSDQVTIANEFVHKCVRVRPSEPRYIQRLELSITHSGDEVEEARVGCIPEELNYSHRGGWAFVRKVFTTNPAEACTGFRFHWWQPDGDCPSHVAADPAITNNQRVVVLAARYQAVDDADDGACVKQKVQEIVDSGRLDIRADNDVLGVDPAVGRTKELLVSYRFGEDPQAPVHTRRAKDGRVLVAADATPTFDEGRHQRFILFERETAQKGLATAVTNVDVVRCEDADNSHFYSERFQEGKNMTVDMNSGRGSGRVSGFGVTLKRGGRRMHLTWER
jgi:hypothetical protein